MSALDRRTVIQRAGCALAGSMLPLVSPSFARDGNATSLAALAAQCSVRIGAAIDREVFEDDAYARLIAAQVNETGNINTFKYDWLRPTGPVANFEAADRLLAFAERLRLPFTATALFWNDYPPPWLVSQSTAERRKLFDAHADEVCGRYAGRISAWVVVNEPFSPWDHLPGHYRKGPWLDAYGTKYIARAFQRARAADPKARLILNEAFCERRDDIGGAVRPAFLKLVRQLRDGGVPVDCVGLQGHVQPQHGLDHEKYARYMEQLAETGVALEITELDVDDSAIPGRQSERAAAVANHYRDFVSAVLTVPALKTITFWGLSDRYTWYRDVAAKANPLAPHQPHALPFDVNGQPTAVVTSLEDTFNRCSIEAPRR